MRRLLRLWCWLVCHRWQVIACDERKNVVLGHLHTFAGCLAVCRTCHAVFDDLPAGPVDELAGWTDGTRYGEKPALPPMKVLR